MPICCTKCIEIVDKRGGGGGGTHQCGGEIDTFIINVGAGAEKKPIFFQNKVFLCLRVMYRGMSDDEQTLYVMKTILCFPREDGEDVQVPK